MPWFLWIPLGCFGVGSVVCFALSYRYLTPAAQKDAARLTLRGTLTRQDIFTPRGWQLRAWAWALAALALITLAIAGLRGTRG